jgi:hypothetical protein
MFFFQFYPCRESQNLLSILDRLTDSQKA